MNSTKALDDFICEQRIKDKVAGLPLKDFRVIDLSTIVAAPFAATLLSDMGAEVIKVENPAMPDGLRAWGVIKEKGIHPFWSVIGRNKFPVTINLNSGLGSVSLPIAANACQLGVCVNERDSACVY